MTANIDYQRAALNKRTQAGGELNGLVCHLLASNTSVNPYTGLPELTEASFDGYAPSPAVSWGVAIANDALQKAEVGALPTAFYAADGSVVQTIYGVYLTTAAGGSPPGGQLAHTAMFLNPVQITRVGSGLYVGLTMSYDGTLVAEVLG